MFIKWIMKNPILMMGTLMMAVFLMDMDRRGLLREGLHKTTSCHASLVKLDRKIPKNWIIHCKEDHMVVEIPLILPEKKLSVKTIKAIHYQKLADHLVTIARHSPPGNLKLIESVSIILKSTSLSIKAGGKGKDVVKLATMKKSEFIARHLQQTVKVTETIK